MAFKLTRCRRLRDGTSYGTMSGKARTQRNAISLADILETSIKEKWRPDNNINKNLGDAKKPAAVRYLKLKSGHAVAVAHLPAEDR